MTSSVSELRAIGPKSAEMLRRAGIHSLADLEQLGSVAAYAKTREVCPEASLNLLWALEAALSGLSWQEVARVHRTTLLLALEDWHKQHP